MKVARFGVHIALAFACVLLPAGRLLAQATGGVAPAQPAPTVTLDYHDVSVETVLPELSQRLQFIVLRTEQIPGNVTLTSSAAVDVQAAAALLNDALWDRGFRIYTSKAGDRMILHVVRRWDPLEIRTWPAFKPPAFRAQLPADMPGISTTKLIVRAQSQPLSSILDPFAPAFGFVIDTLPGKLGEQRFTLQAPDPLTVRQAADLVTLLLSRSGLQLQGDTIQDATGQSRTLLRVVPLKKDAAKRKSVPFAFENAPLSMVMAELGKRSGFAIMDQTVGVQVSMHEILEVDAEGKADVGPLIAKLNKVLEAQSVIIEAAARVADDGQPEPALSAMPVDMARHTILAPPVLHEPKLIPASEWIGVDLKAVKPMRYENVPVSTLLADVCKTYGFVIFTEIQLPQRVTIEVPNPVTAVEAAELVNEAMLPIGYTAMVIPYEPAHATVLWVLPLPDAARMARGLPRAQATGH